MIALILILSIVIQLLAAFLSLRLIRLTGRWSAWIFIAAAILFMGVRRITTFWRGYVGHDLHPPDLHAELISLIISILMLIGILGIAPLLRSIAHSRKKLAESEERLRLVLQNARDIVLVFDLDCYIMYYNGGGDLGLSPADVVGQKAYDIFSAADAEKIISHIQSVLAEPGSSTQEIQLDWQGDLQWYSSLAYPIFDERKQLRAVGYIGRNITDMKAAELRLQEHERIQADFQKRLTALLEISTQLAGASTVDELLYQTVKLSHERLGLERMGIWLLNEDGNEALGTYGISETGQIRNEQAMRHTVTQLKSILIDKIPEKQFHLVHDCELHNDNNEPVGRGSRCCSCIWDGSRLVGYVFSDNLMTAKPLGEEDGELLALLACSLGHLIRIKSAEEDLRRREEAEHRFKQRLEHLLEISTELVGTESQDDLFRRAVELGREKLGFDRLGIWLFIDNTSRVRGTFGTDEQGHVRDERGITFDSGLCPITARLELLPEKLYVINRQANLSDVQGNVVGVGDHCYVCIWDGTRELGYVFADQLFSGVSLDDRDGELLSMYASMLGHLIARKRDETARLESERRLSQLFQLSNDAILLLDNQGRFVQANRAACELSGYAPEQLVSLTINDFSTPEGKPTAWELYSAFLEGRTTRGDFEFIHQDGRRIVAEYSAQSITDNLHMVVLRDITERRIAEEELARHRHHLEDLVEQRTAQLEETRDKFRQTERLASIGTLAAGIAHEINNPVGMILLSAQLGQEARQRGENDEVIDNAFGRIVQNARRCGRIVKSVLQFARQEKTEKWPHCLNTVVQRAVKVSNEYISKKNAHLVCRYDPLLPPVLLNPLEIEQVVINLIQNAVEACRDQAHVEISTESTETSVRLVMQDNGSGISEEHRVRLFDPFYTTRRHEGGTGLGLSIAHGIITEHGGTISLDSRPGKGTRIAIDLPKATVAIKEDSHVQSTHRG